ncbi:MAG: double-strand break repair protein AddB [Pseudomonadota bacterium]
MFEPSDQPRLFGMPLGVDFPKALVEGLRQSHKDKPPDALAKVQLIVNTRRMARRIRDLFDSGPACLLPRINLITDFGEAMGLAQIPEAVPSLRRRLELMQLVGALLDASPDIAPRSAIHELSDSLAKLMDEMQGEAVDPDVISNLDITDQSGHWERIKAFLRIIRPYFDTSSNDLDVETRQRRVIEYFVRLWRQAPPDHPIILAGSTGSRGATQLLMQAVAALPQGAVVLPGFDFDQNEEVWQILMRNEGAEDHPQQRFAAFLRNLDLNPSAVKPWPWSTPKNPARNRLLSLALRPAPVTDQWLIEGPKLEHETSDATRDITLLEAPSTRIEAVCIAMRLRAAAESSEIAALITPDRVLTRQVSSVLDQWGVIPDDSAGLPLHHSAPGRFLRHVAELFSGPTDTALLLTVLKHPLTHRGSDRGPHLRLTRELELYLRRSGPPHPSTSDVQSWAKGESDPYAAQWSDWICQSFLENARPETLRLSERVKQHLEIAEAINRGPNDASKCSLWDGEAGREALKSVSSIAENANFCGPLNAPEYISLFYSVLSQETVRQSIEPHPNILIWGTLEARVQGADLLILAGLNEGVWPEQPAQDPWLNRAMRKQAGLLLPERRIGLSAHDFQQAAAAKNVWMTRSVRSDEAQTVPSRWLNRLSNLLTGMHQNGGQDSLGAMRQRGEDWLKKARALEVFRPIKPEARPSPRPPLASRPRQLSVTDIGRLIRDPYAVYARHVLHLRPLNPLMKAPDALFRGTVLHQVLEAFIKATEKDASLVSETLLQEISETVLAQNVPWGEARAMWLARIGRITRRFVESEFDRRSYSIPVAMEVAGWADIDALGFTLTAKADRIDQDQAGNFFIYDYKTGTPPTVPQQKLFDKQLLLEAAIAEVAGFGDLAAGPVSRATYIGLGSASKEVLAPLDEISTEQVWTELTKLIMSYQSLDQGYTSRRYVERTDFGGDYDHLARFGEWSDADDPDAGPVR